jgi:hypothetical protein
MDAPLGHIMVDGKPKAMLTGPNGDNPQLRKLAAELYKALSNKEEALACIDHKF